MHINVNVFPIVAPLGKKRGKSLDGFFFCIKDHPQLFSILHLVFSFVRKIVHMECAHHVFKCIMNWFSIFHIFILSYTMVFIC